MSKVLVVSHDSELFSLSRGISTPTGYEVCYAATGTEGLSQLANEAPDLIVSDLSLGDMDGLSFLRRVKVLTGAAVPFVFASAHASSSDRLEGLRAGADDWISLPMTPEELDARIAAILRRLARTRADERVRFDALKASTLQELSGRLREPVDSLLADLRLFSEERINESPEVQRQSIRHAIESACRLGHLVDEMGWVNAERSNTTLSWEPVRIAPIVRRSAATASRRTVDKNVQISLSCGGLLSGNVDEAAMVRTLGNLLEAVVDLSPEGSEVSLQARRVQDMGLEFIVAEGRREISGATNGRSLRDALELARSVVRGHNGKMSVRSTEDGRQSYVLWVPGRAPRSRHARA